VLSGSTPLKIALSHSLAGILLTARLSKQTSAIMPFLALIVSLGHATSKTSFMHIIEAFLEAS
jgi:hypothetical protein